MNRNIETRGDFIKKDISSFFKTFAREIVQLTVLSMERNCNVGRSIDTESGPKERNAGKGGFTSCVPHCFSNSRMNRDLSFYTIYNGKSKEKTFLKTRWLHMILRKDFNPAAAHRWNSGIQHANPALCISLVDVRRT